MYPDLGTSERVRADLEILCSLDLTQADTPEPELAYIFRHIVTQEVAYESLPYATRAILHEQLAQFVERAYSESVEQFVDLLAYHYEHTENEDKKREYLLKAGEAAQADYANEAAISYYQRALPLLPPEEKVPVMLKLAEVLQLVGRWHEVNDICREGIALSEQLGDQRTLARCQTAKAGLLRKQGLYTEAAEWLNRARTGFDELGDQAGVGQVLHVEGTLAARQGDYETARTRFDESLTIRRQLEDRSNIAALLSNLGIVARLQGDHSGARALYEESLALRYELGDKWAIANTLNNLGWLHFIEGDYDAARDQLETAVDLLREIGDRREIANALHTLANATRDQGNYVATRPIYEESLMIIRELGDRLLLAYLLEDIGALAALEGQPERALHLLGAAEALREAIGAPLSTDEQDKLRPMLEPARQALGVAKAAAMEAEGRVMSLEQAVAEALQSG
jgi:tetratricopeptide (TPR) repeat protein